MLSRPRGSGREAEHAAGMIQVSLTVAITIDATRQATRTNIVTIQIRGMRT
jgi:hypothetical protein